MKESLTPISMDDFIQKQVDADGPMTREEIRACLMAALRAFRSGVTCSCGNPIWVMGSTLAGNACFTCITGETPTAEDYEIDEACSERQKNERDRKMSAQVTQDKREGVRRGQE